MYVDDDEIDYEEDDQPYSIHYNEEKKFEVLVISHYHLDGRMGGYFTPADTRFSKEAVRFHPVILDAAFKVAWHNGVQHGQMITATVVYKWGYAINNNDTFRYKTLVGVTIDEVSYAGLCHDMPSEKEN